MWLGGMLDAKKLAGIKMLSGISRVSRVTSFNPTLRQEE